MFRTSPLAIIRSISTLYTRIRYLSSQFCLLSASVVILTMLADSRQNQHDKYLLRVYNVEILLMMDSGPVRNMYSTLSNIFKNLCILLDFIIRREFYVWSYILIQEIFIYFQTGMMNKTDNVQRNIKVCLYNNCCCGKTINNTYSECIFVTLCVQHAMPMRRIFICGLSRPSAVFHIIA